MHYASGAAPRQLPAVLPKHIKDALAKARVSWLKNTEVAQLLSCHKALGFEVSQEAPDTPPSERYAFLQTCSDSMKAVRHGNLYCRR